MNIKKIAFGDLVEIARRYQSVSVLVLHNMITDSSDFRCPKNGESYFDADGEKRVALTEHGWVRTLISKTQAISGKTPATITVQDVYGGDMEIPDGYKFVKFGIPKATELLLSRRDHSIISVTAEWDSPRIIVEKI